jgi:PilZ domain
MPQKQIKEPRDARKLLQDSNLPRAMRSPLIAEAILVLQSGAKVKARTTDISIAGCYVTTTIELQRGTAVRVQLLYKGRIFSAMGQVIRSSRNKGTGIKFRTVEPAQLSVLREWLFSQTRATELQSV